MVGPLGSGRFPSLPAGIFTEPVDSKWHTKSLSIPTMARQETVRDYVRDIGSRYSHLPRDQDSAQGSSGRHGTCPGMGLLLESAKAQEGYEDKPLLLIQDADTTKAIPGL